MRLMRAPSGGQFLSSPLLHVYTNEQTGDLQLASCPVRIWPAAAGAEEFICLSLEKPGDTLLPVHLAALDQLHVAAECVAAIEGVAAMSSGTLDAASSHPPPWALTNANGQTLLSISVHTADGGTQEIIPRCAQLPARGETVVTTAAHGVSSLCIQLVVGIRPAASACRSLCVLTLPVEAAMRGLAQVRVAVAASAQSLHVVARDVQTGRSAMSVLRAAQFQTGDGDDEANDGSVQASSPSSCRLGPWPAPWRYETPYTDVPHPGYCCASGAFLATPSAQSEREASERRLGADGEVAPESTAARAWPGAFLLSSYLEQPSVRASLRGARVLELGSGLGIPGLAAWASGASHVLLTDLEENLPRLREVVVANVAGGPVEVLALDWSQPLPAEVAMQRFDYVLAADCVYWTGLFEPLLHTLCALLQPEATAAAPPTRQEEEKGAAAKSRLQEGLQEGRGPTDPPRILITVTSRLDRESQFAAKARALGWTLHELHVPDTPPSFLHTHLFELRWDPSLADAGGASSTPSTSIT